MNRGTIYEISTNPELYPIHTMHPDDLESYYDHEFMYAEDADDNAIKEFKRFLKNFGFKIIEYTDECDETQISFTANTMTKKNYFHRRYMEFISLTQDLSLDDFIHNSTQLTHLINDDSSDAVYLDSSFMTMDDFIRHMDTTKRYYVGNACNMHM